MSFLKCSDPVKRDLIVKEYLKLKKNIRDNFHSERAGEQQLQTDLSKFFKPITEKQKATMSEITERLKPIREGIKNLPQAITFPAYPSIQASKKPLEGVGTQVGTGSSGKVSRFLRSKSVTKKEMNKCMAEIYDPGGIRTRAARLISQYHNH